MLTFSSDEASKFWDPNPAEPNSRRMVNISSFGFFLSLRNSHPLEFLYEVFPNHEPEYRRVVSFSCVNTLCWSVFCHVEIWKWDVVPNLNSCRINIPWRPPSLRLGYLDGPGFLAVTLTFYGSVLTQNLGCGAQSTYLIRECFLTRRLMNFTESNSTI